MLFTGARLAELVPSERSTHVAMLKSEVDLENKVLTLRTAKQRKGMSTTLPKARIMKIPDHVAALLDRQMATTEGAHVFPRLLNVPRDLNEILTKAGIPKVDALGMKITAHSFRHTFGSMMAEVLQNNAFLLKEAMGHKKLCSTERYVNISAPMLELSLPHVGA